MIDGQTSRFWNEPCPDCSTRPREADRAAAFEQRLRSALLQFSSLTIGRGDVHDGERGFIVYENEIPALARALSSEAMPVSPPENPKPILKV